MGKVYELPAETGTYNITLPEQNQPESPEPETNRETNEDDSDEEC